MRRTTWFPDVRDVWRSNYANPTAHMLIVEHCCFGVSAVLNSEQLPSSDRAVQNVEDGTTVCYKHDHYRNDRSFSSGSCNAAHPPSLTRTPWGLTVSYRSTGGCVWKFRCEWSYRASARERARCRSAASPPSRMCGRCFTSDARGEWGQARNS
ncbi:hypothetical protein PsYK624_126990 [Phanerochaete sordida]|uniref:Uncharacterized protein n=1 Tax=Phanerochaete sordida TaxID=48140 RepID=A0A9P3GJ49_9APHY|nr:hypothetical protein PsYK624_126990 [Phanerochaete sordida]